MIREKNCSKIIINLKKNRGEKMKNFLGYASNGEYSVGCTGQTVYLFNKDGNELAKFKDLKYAYSPIISPDGKIFVVKSTEGRIAVYSLESVSLIKKFRFSKVNGSQDDNFCFSPDGEEFYNIERHIDSCKTALSVYDTSEFSLKKKVLYDDYNIVLAAVEYSLEENKIFLLGFMREPQSGVAYKFFVGELAKDSLQNIIYISEKEYGFYLDCKHFEMHSFAVTKYYTAEEIDTIKKAKHSLEKLWKYYSK